MLKNVDLCLHELFSFLLTSNIQKVASTKKCILFGYSVQNLGFFGIVVVRTKDKSFFEKAKKYYRIISAIFSPSSKVLKLFSVDTKKQTH